LVDGKEDALENKSQSDLIYPKFSSLIR